MTFPDIMSGALRSLQEGTRLLYIMAAHGRTCLAGTRGSNPLFYQIKIRAKALLFIWRKGWDSNPRDP